MKKEYDVKEFEDMVRNSHSLTPALGLLATIYKQSIPENATLENNAQSCYMSGAYSALLLMYRLGHLTNKGMHLAENYFIVCKSIEDE